MVARTEPRTDPAGLNPSVPLGIERDAFEHGKSYRIRADARATAIRIAGAGIAGLTAAIVLSRAGQRVEVFEMKARVGSSAGPHSEGIRNYLGRDGLDDLARFGPVVKPFSVATRVVRHSPHLANTIRGPSYYLVARGSGPGTLERQLLEQAIDAGARVHFKKKVSRADVDLWATGAPRDKVNIIAAGYRFTREGSNLPDREIHSLWDNNVAPHGYLCLLPGPMWHSIYACAWGGVPYADLLRRVDRVLRHDWVRDLVDEAGIVGRIYGKGFFDPDPLRGLSSAKPLVAGEAGGIQDAVGGFGIRYSVASGALAAQALLGGTNYVAALQAEFQDDFAVAMRGREWLDRATNDDFDELVRRLGPEGQVEDYATWRKTRFL
jgi:flavin-dependent dehydrogenase